MWSVFSYSFCHSIDINAVVVVVVVVGGVEVDIDGGSSVNP